MISARHATLAIREKSLTECPDIPEDFVRLFAEFEIKPAKFSIITPDDQMVPRGVNVYG